MFWHRPSKSPRGIIVFVNTSIKCRRFRGFNEDNNVSYLCLFRILEKAGGKLRCLKGGCIEVVELWELTASRFSRSPLLWTEQNSWFGSIASSSCMYLHSSFQFHEKVLSSCLSASSPESVSENVLRLFECILADLLKVILKSFIVLFKYSRTQVYSSFYLVF